jgi:hypothetical protein
MGVRPAALQRQPDDHGGALAARALSTSSPQKPPQDQPAPPVFFNGYMLWSFKVKTVK